MNRKILRNKNCFITGASGGIGREIALKLSESGCNMFLAGRNTSKLINLKKEIESFGKKVKVFYDTADLSKTADIINIIKVVRHKMGTIDVLVNCAGVFQVKSLNDANEKDFDECININVRAPFIFCKEFSKDMVKKKWGRIVNIGSSSAYNGFKDTIIYCTTKHAVLGMSRAIHNELKEHKVRTYCISPGSVKTKMGKMLKSQNYETFIDAKEIAQYVDFLISFDDNMVSEEVRLNRMFV
ncbi:MAG: SDR family oxidoreductase [Elusimicrobia bacterium]|nr:SDR family oxidoreductase [Candidatus Liberimonas magnetica]